MTVLSDETHQTETGLEPWTGASPLASALCGLPFLFLLCGIVAALRLLAVGWAVLCRVWVSGLTVWVHAWYVWRACSVVLLRGRIPTVD